MKESSLAGPPVTTSGEKSEGVNGGETGDEDSEKSLLSLSILSFPILFVSILRVCVCVTQLQTMPIRVGSSSAGRQRRSWGPPKSRSRSSFSSDGEADGCVCVVNGIFLGGQFDVIAFFLWDLLFSCAE